jgi:hypothetical protein
MESVNDEISEWKNPRWFDRTFKGVQEITPKFFSGKEYSKVETDETKFITTSLTAGGANFEEINPIKKNYNFEDNVIGKKSRNSKLFLLTGMENSDNPKYLSQYLAFYNGRQKNFEKEFRNSLEKGFTLHNSWRLDFSDFEKKGVSAHLNMGYNCLANQTLYLVRGIAQEFFIAKCRYLDLMLRGYNVYNKSNLEVKKTIDYNLFPFSPLWGTTNRDKKTSISMNAYGD